MLGRAPFFTIAIAGYSIYNYKKRYIPQGEKPMKKLATILLVILTAAALCLPASAAGSAAVYAGSATVKPGGQVTFTVTVSASGLRSIAVIPTYDQNTFELVSGQWLVNGTLKDFSVAEGNGVIAFDSATNLNGEVLRFTLKAKSGAAVGKYTVGAQLTLSDSAGNSNITATGAAVQIPCEHRYDNNCDDRCNLCGAKRTPPHSYGKPQSVDGSKHKFTCSGCGVSFTANHTWDNGVITTPATEETPGVKTYTCTGCGQTRTEELSLIPHEHDFSGEWIIDEEGHHHACACGEVQDQDVHIFGDPVLVTKPTCGESGLARRECTVCGYTVEEDLGKLSHQWDEGTVTKEPTAQTEGEKTYTCGICGETEREILPKLQGPAPTEPAPEPTAPAETPEASPWSSPLLWAVVGEGVVILALIVCLIVVKKRT